MRIRYPPALTPGSTIGITAPSAGVADHHRPRLDFCVAWLRERGCEVVVGECMDGAGVTSAPPRERAAELTAMLTDNVAGARRRRARRSDGQPVAAAHAAQRPRGL